MKNINRYNLIFILVAVLVFGFAMKPAKAEQTGTSGESGATSYIKTTYNSLVSLGYGSDAAGAWGNWGSYLNRIRSSGEWVPSSNATVTDVRAGKTFYSNSRTQLVGTYPAVSNCSTQEWNDSNASASKANNCGLDWVTADPAVTGDDKLDLRTGLVWSQYLRNNAGTVVFGGTVSSWSWDATGVNNIAVGNKTALELCSERGDGWRLPTLKEYMQGLVDGMYFSATISGTNHWVGTYSGTGAAYMTLATSRVSVAAFGSAYVVRCVR